MLIWTFNYYQNQIQFRDLPVFETLAFSRIVVKRDEQTKQKKMQKTGKEVEFPFINQDNVNKR